MSTNKDTMAKLIERGAVMKRLQVGEITQKVASMQLNITERQVRRLLRRYTAEGSRGLIHKNTGRVSPRKTSKTIETGAIEWLKEYGPDFGSTFSQEKLVEYLGITVSVGTVRTWRIKYGLHSPRRKRSKKEFMRRKRKHLFGLMVQIDGSPHDWFEGRRAKCMLLTAIDDATGKILARFAEEEETGELMILMRKYVEKYGRPHMVYTDHGAPYKVNTGNHDGNKKTQLGRAFDQLNIKLVHAHSPEAKGRVERNHKTHQDRLVKEMRLRGISDIDSANKYLEEEYIPAFNETFVVLPAGTQDAHNRLNGVNLDNIFCLQEERTIQNDGIVQFEKRILQVTKNRGRVQAKSKVLVRKHLDGSVTIWIDRIQLGYEELAAMPLRIITPMSSRPVAIPRPATNANRDWNKRIYRPYKLKHDYNGAVQLEGE